MISSSKEIKMWIPGLVLILAILKSTANEQYSLLTGRLNLPNYNRTFSLAADFAKFIVSYCSLFFKELTLIILLFPKNISHKTRTLEKSKTDLVRSSMLVFKNNSQYKVELFNNHGNLFFGYFYFFSFKEKLIESFECAKRSQRPIAKQYGECFPFD
jgi:hypothetical protein